MGCKRACRAAGYGVIGMWHGEAVRSMRAYTDTLAFAEQLRERVSQLCG